MIHLLTHRKWRSRNGGWSLELAALGDETYVGACYRRLLEAGVHRSDVQMAPLEIDAPFWHDSEDGRDYLCAGVGSLDYCNDVQRRLLGPLVCPVTAPANREDLFLVVRRDDYGNGKPNPLDVHLTHAVPGALLWFGATLHPGLATRFREECTNKEALSHV